MAYVKSLIVIDDYVGAFDFPDAIFFDHFQEKTVRIDLSAVFNNILAVALDDFNISFARLQVLHALNDEVFDFRFRNFNGCVWIGVRICRASHHLISNAGLIRIWSRCRSCMPDSRVVSLDHVVATDLPLSGPLAIMTYVTDSSQNSSAILSFDFDSPD